MSYQNCNANELLLDYIGYKGCYTKIALDINGVAYPKFITAFNKFWDASKHYYISFFKKNVFSDEEMLASQGLKPISNSYFMQWLLSKDFQGLNTQLEAILEFKDENSILSSMNMRMKIIKEIVNNQSDEQIDYSLLSTIKPFADSLTEYEKRKIHPSSTT